MPTLNWKCHDSYASARHYKGVIYLFEWNKKPFYWGIAEKNSFGVRYNPGYRHLIQASLANGGKLYIAEVEDQGESPLRDIENYLMVAHGYVANARVNQDGPTFDLKHKGDVPASVLSSNNSADIGHSPVDNRRKSHNVTSHDKKRNTKSDPVWKYEFTHSKKKVFTYTVTPESLIIHRGSNLQITTKLYGETLIQLQEYLINDFGNGSFPLANKLNQNAGEEPGLATAIKKTFKTEDAGFAQVASQLCVLFCEIGIFTRYIKPSRVYGNRYLINCSQLPESWNEMREWLEGLPDKPILPGAA